MTDASSPALGLSIAMLSGVLTASFPFPMKYSRAWKWENTWLVYATLALLVIPVSLASWAVPHLFSFYASVPPESFVLPLLFGFGWGIAQTTFGLAIERAGMAMAFAIVIGLSAVIGSFVPLAIFHARALAGRPGAVLLVSAIILICGLFLYATAARERDVKPEAERTSRRLFLIGLALCIFTGCFGAMINLGFVSGGDIARLAAARGVSPVKATLSVWAVVLAAGYVPNVLYTLYLMRRNRSGRRFPQSFPREGMLALAAAVLWLFGMLGYGMGATVMGSYGNSIGFAAAMMVLLLWSSVLGILSGEWRGAPMHARRRMRLSVAVIIVSMLTLGFGSLLYQ